MHRGTTVVAHSCQRKHKESWWVTNRDQQQLFFYYRTLLYFNEFTFRLPNTPVRHSEALVTEEKYLLE